MSLYEEAKSIIKNKVPSRHTCFQLNFFILGKEPTHQAKLRRCVEELKVKINSVENIDLEIEELKEKLGMVKNARKEYAVNRQIEKLEDSKKNTEEEILFFVEAFKKLNNIEPMKDWDDIEVQKEYWNAKLTEEINYRLLMRLPLDAEIVKTALAMPNETPIKCHILSLLNSQRDKLIEHKEAK
jgi:hypothetical protein